MPVIASYGCSLSGYAYTMKVYSGRKTESSGMPLGEDVVTHLLSVVADPGRYLINFDNFLHLIFLFKSWQIQVRSNRIRQSPLFDNRTIVKETRGAVGYRSDGTVFICRCDGSL